jgi:transposase
MPGRKTKLGCPEVAAVIDDLHAKEPDGWRKNRLLAVKLAAKGEFTSDEIADLCGVSRTHIYKWFKIARESGLDALLEREKPGPREGSCRGIAPELLDDLKNKLESNDFVTVVQAQRWLEQKDGIKRPYSTVWVWLKKFGGVLLVPRPSHSKKIPRRQKPSAMNLVNAWNRCKSLLGAKLKSG